MKTHCAAQSQAWLAPQLLGCQFFRDDWSAVEDTLKLAGWDKARRVVVLRRAVKADLALSRNTQNEPDELIELLMPDKDVQAWEYAMLVTNSAYALERFGQLYRDRARAHCENGCDELKNQWGWGGFTTQDIGRCQTSTRVVKHAGQTTLYLTPMHAAVNKLMALIANICAALNHVSLVAEQLPRANRWKSFVDYVVAKITRPLPHWLPPDFLALTG